MVKWEEAPTATGAAPTGTARDVLSELMDLFEGDASEALDRLLSSSTSGAPSALLSQYVDASPQCVEIFAAVEKQSGVKTPSKAVLARGLECLAQVVRGQFQTTARSMHSSNRVALEVASKFEMLLPAVKLESDHTRVAALRLLEALARHSVGLTTSILIGFNFASQAFSGVLQRKKDSSTAVREVGIDFVCAMLSWQNRDATKRLLGIGTLLPPLMQGLGQDPPVTVLRFLAAIRRDVLEAPTIPRLTKVFLFNTKTLLHFGALVAGADADVVEAVKELLLDLLSGRKMYMEKDEDAIVKLLTLWNPMEVAQQDIVVAVLEGPFAHLAPRVFRNLHISITAQLTLKNLANVTAATRLLRLAPLWSPISDGLQHELLPKAVNQAVLLQLCSGPSKLLRLKALELIVAAATRLSTASKMASSESSDQDAIRECCASLPLTDSVVGLWKTYTSAFASGGDTEALLFVRWLHVLQCYLALMPWTFAQLVFNWQKLVEGVWKLSETKACKHSTPIVMAATIRLVLSVAQAGFTSEPSKAHLACLDIALRARANCEAGSNVQAARALVTTVSEYLTAAGIFDEYELPLWLDAVKANTVAFFVQMVREATQNPFAAARAAHTDRGNLPPILALSLRAARRGGTTAPEHALIFGVAAAFTTLRPDLRGVLGEIIERQGQVEASKTAEERSRVKQRSALGDEALEVLAGLAGDGAPAAKRRKVERSAFKEWLGRDAPVEVRVVAVMQAIAAGSAASGDPATEKEILEVLEAVRGGGGCSDAVGLVLLQSISRVPKPCVESACDALRMCPCASLSDRPEWVDLAGLKPAARIMAVGAFGKCLLSTDSAALRQACQIGLLGFIGPNSGDAGNESLLAEVVPFLISRGLGGAVVDWMQAGKVNTRYYPLILRCLLASGAKRLPCLCQLICGLLEDRSCRVAAVDLLVLLAGIPNGIEAIAAECESSVFFSGDTGMLSHDPALLQLLVKLCRYHADFRQRFFAILSWQTHDPGSVLAICAHLTTFLEGTILLDTVPASACFHHQPTVAELLALVRLRPTNALRTTLRDQAAKGNYAAGVAVCTHLLETSEPSTTVELFRTVIAKRPDDVAPDLAKAEVLLACLAIRKCGTLVRDDIRRFVKTLVNGGDHVGPAEVVCSVLDHAPSTKLLAQAANMLERADDPAPLWVCRLASRPQVAINRSEPFRWHEYTASMSSKDRYLRLAMLQHKLGVVDGCTEDGFAVLRDACHTLPFWESEPWKWHLHPERWNATQSTFPFDRSFADDSAANDCEDTDDTDGASGAAPYDIAYLLPFLLGQFRILHVQLSDTTWGAVIETLLKQVFAVAAPVLMLGSSCDDDCLRGCSLDSLAILADALHRLCQHQQELKVFKEAPQSLGLLRVLQNGFEIGESSWIPPAAPTIQTAVLATAAGVVLHPDHELFMVVVRMMSKSVRLSPSVLPLFRMLFQSPSVAGHHQRRAWMLKALRRGVAGLSTAGGRATFRALVRDVAVEVVLATMSSPFCDWPTWFSAADVLVAVTAPGRTGGTEERAQAGKRARILVSIMGLLPWMQRNAAVLVSRFGEMYARRRAVSALLQILENTAQACLGGPVDRLSTTAVRACFAAGSHVVHSQVALVTAELSRAAVVLGGAAVAAGCDDLAQQVLPRLVCLLSVAPQLAVRQNVVAEGSAGQVGDGLRCLSAVRVAVCAVLRAVPRPEVAFVSLRPCDVFCVLGAAFRDPGALSLAEHALQRTLSWNAQSEQRMLLGLTSIAAYLSTAPSKVDAVWTTRVAESCSWVPDVEPSAAQRVRNLAEALRVGRAAARTALGDELQDDCPIAAVRDDSDSDSADDLPVSDADVA